MLPGKISNITRPGEALHLPFINKLNVDVIWTSLGYPLLETILVKYFLSRFIKVSL